MPYGLFSPYAHLESANGTLLLVRGIDGQAVTPLYARMGYSSAGIICFGKLCLRSRHLELEEMGRVWFRRIVASDLCCQRNSYWICTSLAGTCWPGNSRFSGTPGLESNGVAALISFAIYKISLSHLCVGHFLPLLKYNFAHDY